MSSSSPCTVPACSRPAVGRGLCNTHYQRRRRGRAVEGALQPKGGMEPLPIIKIPTQIARALRRDARAAGWTLSDQVRMVLVGWFSRRGGRVADVMRAMIAESEEPDGSR